MFKYTIIIEKMERNNSAYCPDLPGCIATGQTDPEEKGIQNGEKSRCKENGDNYLVHAHKGGTLQDGIITDIMVLHLRTRRARAPPALN
jgi:hypothetical protein